MLVNRKCFRPQRPIPDRDIKHMCNNNDIGVRTSVGGRSMNHLKVIVDWSSATFPIGTYWKCSLWMPVDVCRPVPTDLRCDQKCDQNCDRICGHICDAVDADLSIQTAQMWPEMLPECYQMSPHLQVSLAFTSQFSHIVVTFLCSWSHSQVSSGFTLLFPPFL